MVGWLSRYSVDFSLSLPPIDTLHCGVWTFSKNNPQRFLILPVSPPGLQYFSKGVCSLNVAVLRKESSSLRHFLGNNQELRTSVLKT